MTEAAPAGTRPSHLARALRAVPPLLLAAACAALAIRLGGRDGSRLLAPLFYASPLGVVLLWAAAAAVLAAAQRRRGLALAATAAAAVAGTWLAANEVKLPPRDAAAAPGVRRPPLRGVLWNTQEGRGSWERKLQVVRDLDPDLLVLVEGPETAADAAFWRESLPDHAMLALPGRRFAFVRGPAARVSPWLGFPERDGDAPAAWVDGAGPPGGPGRAFGVVVVDLPGNPFRERGPRISRLLERAAEGGEGRLLVLGDFNTPRDSAHFDPWRGPLRSAFEVAGEGYGATWPVPLPVLSLDQVWAGPGIDLVRCTTKWTWESDHLPVAFEFDVRE